MRMAKVFAAALALTAFSRAAEPWLDLVAPVISSAEKKTYLSLTTLEREKFREVFWANKAIGESEYRERLEYIDATFGSTKIASGANTDQGRVYLALGAPNRITRIPASRLFYSIEIWYYSIVPGVINTEVSLMFFQKNGAGFPKLYSPTTDTIRALLAPQSSTVHMFGPNDGLMNEAQIRETLKVPPAEDEVIGASVNVAKGIRHEGNDELLAKVSSPAYIFSLPLRTDVRSKITYGHPKLDVFMTSSAFGGAQVDLGLDTAARGSISIKVAAGRLPIYENRLNLKFAKLTPVHYTHRLDLLPGNYRVIFDVDGSSFSYNVPVADRLAMGEILRAEETDLNAEHRFTPFSFEGRRIELDSDGKFAVVAVAKPGVVKWKIRQGLNGVVWRAEGTATQIAQVEIPQLPPGLYKLEASAGDEVRGADLIVKEKSARPGGRTMLSFNANLHPAQRYTFEGHQWLLRGNSDEARKSLKLSLDKGATDEARVELARVEAMAGNLDRARDLAGSVLTEKPNHFEALSVLAYVETRFQDYVVAADLYRKALAVQESPALRAALETLPVK